MQFPIARCRYRGNPCRRCLVPHSLNKIQAEFGHLFPKLKLNPRRYAFSSFDNSRSPRMSAPVFGHPPSFASLSLPPVPTQAPAGVTDPHVLSIALVWFVLCASKRRLGHGSSGLMHSMNTSRLRWMRLRERYCPAPMTLSIFLHGARRYRRSSRPKRHARTHPTQEKRMPNAKPTFASPATWARPVVQVLSKATPRHGGAIGKQVLLETELCGHYWSARLDAIVLRALRERNRLAEGQ